MNAICARCKETFNTAQLVPYDIYEFELTAKGIHAFASNEAYLTLQKDIEVGISSYENFAESLRILASMNDANDDFLVLGRLWIIGENGAVLPIRSDHIILQYVYMRFKNFKVATDGKMIYIAQLVSIDEEKSQKAFVERQFTALQREMITFRLEHASIRYEIFSVTKSDFNEQFIKELKNIPPTY